MKNSSFRIFYCALLTAYCALFTGCFHKDVMNDPADDVSQTFVYEGKNGSYIITNEYIFQATSKSSGGGMTQISGYNEARLTSYDLTTGAMLGRVETGDAIDDGCQIIGIVNDQVWCYSVDPDIGLHYRDPKTMEIVKKENEITAFSGYDFSRPEWSRIHDYYGFDVSNQMLVLTDMQGLLSYYDAAGNSLEETENPMPEVEWSPDYLTSSVYFDKDEYISFSGERDRKLLQWKYEDTTADLPFLKPELFVELNPEHLWKMKQDRITRAKFRVDSIHAFLDSVYVEHPILHPTLINEYESYGRMTPEERELRNDVYSWNSDLSDAIDDLDDLTDEFDDSNDYALHDQAYSALIWSANSVADTARAIVTCVDMTKPKKFVERWHLDLTSFYYDSDKAEGAGVFDEGDPEFRYKWAEIHDGKFVMIAQLQMICVDMKSGQKLWQITL